MGKMLCALKETSMSKIKDILNEALQKNSIVYGDLKGLYEDSPESYNFIQLLNGERKSLIEIEEMLLQVETLKYCGDWDSFYASEIFA